MHHAPAAPSLKSLSQAAGASRSYYSIAEVAALLGVSRVSVWRWISSGRLPVARLGHRTVRVKREDLASVVRPSRAISPLTDLVAEPIEGLHADSADHLVMFYDAERFLIDGVADFIGPALQEDERALVVATLAHREAIERRLRADGVDVARAIANGSYVAADAAQTLARFMVDQRPDPTRFEEVLRGLLGTSTKSTGRPRIFGEMVALLVAEAKPEAALELEALWNVQAKKRPFALMCAYPMEQLGGGPLAEVLDGVCAEHSTVVPAESYSALNDSDARLRAIAALQQKAASLEREVAERHRVEEQLQVALAAERAARAEVEAALRVREEFLSVASHELRTPIAIMSAQAQLSLRRLDRQAEVDPERIKHAMRTMGSQAVKLGRLVGQLLDVSRLDGGNLQVEVQRTNLAHLVEQVVSAGRTLSHKHAIEFTAPARIDCDVDALRVEQVVLNLIDNAIKYSPEGGPVHVAVTQCSAHGVEVSVRDHGLGIPVERRGQIFERFYQAHEGQYRSGMGLGLYVSRRIVELHGGEICAEFPADGGTRMVVRLPIAQSSVRASVAAD